MEYGQAANVTVNVSAAAGVDVSTGGTVTVKNGAATVATAPVVAGVATRDSAGELAGARGPRRSPRRTPATRNVKPSEDTFTVTAEKADSTVVAPDVAVAPGWGRHRARSRSPPSGVTPTGPVTVKNGATELGSATRARWAWLS